MARRRSTRRRSPRRRRSARRGRSTFRASRRGFMGGGIVNMAAGTLIGAAAAIGGSALLTTGANLAKIQLPQVVKDFGPIAGAGVIAGLAALSKRWKDLTMPALIGGVAMVGLGMLLKAKSNGAGAYDRLRGTMGAGVASRILAGPGARGAGNVANRVAAVA